jgi:hypothetical protein
MKTHLPQKLRSETITDHQDKLRRWIGILGILLPVVLWIGAIAFGAEWKYHPLPSISHYYYSRMSAVFVIIVSMLAIFLIFYQYRDKEGNYPIGDALLSSLAGFAALLLLLFPTNFIKDSGMIGDLEIGDFGKAFHFSCAAVFLGCLAIMMIFLFTKTDKTQPLSRAKKFKKYLYIILGSLMIAAMLVILIGGLFGKIPNYDMLKLTFWMETVAVMFFGIGWLVKGS